MGFYENLNYKVRRHPGLCKLMLISNKVISAYTFVCFPLICLHLLVTSDFEMLGKTVVLTALGFVFVTVLRKIVKRERPYVSGGYQPVFAKESKYDSFPSRHTYSAVVIALAAFQVSPWLFALNITLSLILALFRVLGGVHRVTDVIFALLIAIAFGFVLLI